MLAYTQTHAYTRMQSHMCLCSALFTLVKPKKKNQAEKRLNKREKELRLHSQTRHYIGDREKHFRKIAI